MAKETVITRDELYNKVWAKPMIQLAKEFSISDRGLAKICEKYQIPRPGLGYWAKLANQVSTILLAPQEADLLCTVGDTGLEPVTSCL